MFADAGVMAIEHADFDGIERLALVTGGEIVSTFGHPELVKLGRCDLIEEVGFSLFILPCWFSYELQIKVPFSFSFCQIMVGEDKLLRFSGVPLGEACTLVLRGATQQILDEAERSIHDALCVLASTVKETRTVYGGGRLLLLFQGLAMI